MEHSKLYNFFLNQWKLKKVDELYLQNQVSRGRITQSEYNEIVATPQI